MDGAADATAAALGAWASIRGFFTPATLFIVVNLVIGTIALSSHFQQRRRRGNGYTAHEDARHQEQQPFHHVQHQENQYYDDQQQHHEQQYVPPPPAPAPLARTSSVLDRLRSIGLYRFRSGDFPPEYATGTDSQDGIAPAPASGDAHHARSRSEPALAREVRRRPAASRARKSPRSVRPEVAPAPAARLVQSAVMEEDDADDDIVEQEYARTDEFTGSNFVTQPLPPALQLQEEEEEHSPYREEYVPPFRPARAPSVLERIRSFGFRSGDPAAGHAASAVPVEEEADDVEEEEYARADVFKDRNFTTHRQQQQPPPARHEEEQYYREEYVPPPRPAPLARAPSVLERLRSFGLSRFSSGNIAADDAAAAVAELERNHAQKQAKMTKSRSEPSREQSNKGKESGVAKMSKSGSVARKPAPVEPQAEEGGVDARADDFINSFRKQLQLQRVNSLLNYKDMLNRGA